MNDRVYKSRYSTTHDSVWKTDVFRVLRWVLRVSSRLLHLREILRQSWPVDWVSIQPFRIRQSRNHPYPGTRWFDCFPYMSSFVCMFVHKLMCTLICIHSHASPLSFRNTYLQLRIRHAFSAWGWLCDRHKWHVTGIRHETIGVALAWHWLHRCRWIVCMGGHGPRLMRTSFGMRDPFWRDDMKSVDDIFCYWGSKYMATFHISKINRTFIC